MAPKNSDFEELFKNRCEGFKGCLDREANIELEECKDCLVEALGELFSVFAKEPEGI